MSDTLRVLIVDDEFHARKLLSEYVSKLSFLHLIASCPNVFEAMSILQKEKVDILLLDIQMPEITGMEFARSLKKPPAVIFTTAYKEYAVESYELDVVDYLLKPIAFPRFLQAINKVIERKGIEPDIKSSTLPAPKDNEYIEDAQEKNIVIKSGYKFYKINYSELIYIEGQREYVTIHTTKERITLLSSLKDLEEKLSPDYFIRIHKSYIVSIQKIDFIEKDFLHIGGRKLAIGRVYKNELMKLFENK